MRFPVAILSAFSKFYNFTLTLFNSLDTTRGILHFIFEKLIDLLIL